MRSKKIIYNVITNLLLQFVTVIYGFIVPKIIITNFGSNINGLTASITQFLSYITLLESGVGPIIKAALYKPIANKDKKTIGNILRASEKFFRRISFIFIFYIIVLCIIFPTFINSNYDIFFTISLILIISISTFAEYYFGITYRLYIQAEQKNYIISMIQIGTYILNTITVVILALNHSSIHIIKLVTALIFVLRPIIQNFYVKKCYKINLKNSLDNYEIENKWSGFSQHIAYVIHSSTDITILSFYGLLGEISIYSVYNLVMNGVRKIIQSFSLGIDATFGDMIVKKEKENLLRKFNLYENIYFTILTIVFTSTFVLINYFIKVYTRNITDINYLRYTFGSIFTISEYIWAIRLPYSNLAQSAGHFNETKKGAWVESILNIFISIILVKKYKLVGVAIGTLVAMIIRTVEFIWHANKYILCRNILINIKRIVILMLETILLIIFYNCFVNISIDTYFSWFIYALFVFTLNSIFVIAFDFIFNKKEVMSIISIFKRNLNFRKGIKNNE